MSEDKPPLPPDPPVNLVAFGMACAVSSAILLLYAGDYMFLRLNHFRDVFNSVKVRIPMVTELVLDYGIVLWGLVLIGTIISIDQALRKGGLRRTININFGVLAAAIVLAFLVRQAFWHPMLSLFQGVGANR